MDSKTYRTGQSDAAEDFNTLYSSSGNPQGKRPAQANRHAPRKKSPLPLILAIAAAAVVLVLIAIVVIVALGGTKNITYENNAYIAYADSDGKYHVSVNGKELDVELEGVDGVDVIPYADHSFAYVLDHGAEGVTVYLLEGKNIEEITSTPVLEVLDCASMTPAIVVAEDDGLYLYVDGGDERIVRNTANPEDVIISADASTVVYTAEPSNGDGTRRLYAYQNGSPDPIQRNCIPVAVSTYGDYIYGTTTKDGQNVLYVITTEDAEPYLINNSEGFTGITAMNVEGNEILFCTSNGTQSTSYIYSIKKAGEGETHKLTSSNVIMTPANADPSIAVYGTFANTYMSAIADDGSDKGVFYVDKDYKATRVAPVQGQFDPDGKYFYYISTNIDAEEASSGMLKQVDLNSDSYPSRNVFNNSIKAFVVTEKGNIYNLDSENTLRFYDVSEGTNYRRGFGDEIGGISFYHYANEIYFSIADVDGNNVVYSSEEGSEKKATKLDSIQITDVLQFSNSHSKRTYAYYYDLNTNVWMLFYTSSGKRFELISSDCQQINGVEIPNSIG